jgi:CheY-like chemotaxis protein
MPTLNILLIEDSEPDIILVREVLNRAGLDFELNVLGDGEKAIDFVDALDHGRSNARPHLVLLDLSLPRRSGDEVLEHMRRSERWQGVPVIVITSSDAPRDKAEASRLGATFYFRKPSRLDEFMLLGQFVRGAIGE